MPVEVITNPGRVNNTGGVLAGTSTQLTMPVALDPNITQATINALVPTVLPSGVAAASAPGVGACVELQTWNGATSGATGSPTFPTVALSSTTADFLLLGIITGWQIADAGVTINTTKTVPTVVQVATAGDVVAVLTDHASNITAGHVLTQSAATAGLLTDGGTTWVAGKTVGVALTSLTISSGIGLVFAKIGCVG